MANSKQIAGIAGPTLVALSVTEGLNLHIWATNIAPVTYLNGCILFIIGLSLIRFHNVWTRRWPVLITLVGWVLLIGGLYRMIAPTAPQAGESVATYAVLTIIFLIGCILTFNGLRRGE